MIDNKTQHLNLPLPDPDNLLEDDVNRLVTALTGIDIYAKTTDAALAQKADKTAVDYAFSAVGSALAQKADSATVDAELAKTNSALKAGLARNVAKFTSLANSGRADIAAGASFNVPSYVVGSGKLFVYLESCLCLEGEYAETGAAGAVSTSIKWLCAVPKDFTIGVIVLP